jgi:hypothetical protein
MKTFYLTIVFLLFISINYAQQKYTLSGYITDDWGRVDRRQCYA